MVLFNWHVFGTAGYRQYIIAGEFGYSQWPMWCHLAVLHKWKVSTEVGAWYMAYDVWALVSFVPDL